MSAQSGQLHHSPRTLDEPSGWVIYLSHSQPERLVVFVHGFGGKAISSWQQFPLGAVGSDWWRHSDMLFVGYPSKSDDISGVADRLRQGVEHFYPALPEELLEVGGKRLRDTAEAPYRELFLVGHSLGGVVVRRSLCDAAQRWLLALDKDPKAPRPALLEAQVRLFSPASAGFRAAGFLGALRATRRWGAIEMFLRRSSAYSDIQQGSVTLTNLSDETAALLELKDPRLQALRAHILWASPDRVVLAERYKTDYPSNFAHGADHRSVCKPQAAWPLPWTFVEEGDLG
jgi:pimeloyl-ACP methyl ester carboxylesterase